MNRRSLIGGIASGVVVCAAGCMRYTRSSPSDYELLDSGYTDETAWLDVRYSGDSDGKVQYRLYIKEDGVFVAESGTEAKEVTVDSKHRLTAEMPDVIFDRENASVGIEIRNTESTDDGVGKRVGTVEMDQG